MIVNPDKFQVGRSDNGNIEFVSEASRSLG